MRTVPDLLKLAQDCYARARNSLDQDAKVDFVRLGDRYLHEADELQRGRAVVQAAFPKNGDRR